MLLTGLLLGQVRIDSGDPEIEPSPQLTGGKKGEDTNKKLIIFSDGLDTKKIKICTKFNKKVQIGFGWGTWLTNDFRGLIEDGALTLFH